VDADSAVTDYWWAPIVLAMLVMLIVAGSVLHEAWKNRR
jgi:hypothetical protein